MALRGDSVDNIPGAPGIGDKGSVELIRNSAASRRCSIVPPRSSARPIASRWSRIATPFCFPRNWSPSTAMCRSRWTWTRWRRRRPTSKPAASFSPSLSLRRCCASLRPQRRPTAVELIEEPTASRPPHSTLPRASTALPLRSMPRQPAAEERKTSRRGAIAARCGRGRGKQDQLQRRCLRRAWQRLAPAAHAGVARPARRRRRSQAHHDWKLALHVLDEHGS